MTAGRPRAQDVDRHVGARLRELRISAGLSQQALGDLIGVTYQQAHKYESGVNRISASRLFALALALDVEVNEFFEGLAAPDAIRHIAEQRQVVDLARHFRQIVAPMHRQLVLRMAAALAGNGAADAALAGGD
jgi:transcriptional regulator with XRE-family HTH domain